MLEDINGPVQNISKIVTNQENSSKITKKVNKPKAKLNKTVKNKKNHNVKIPTIVSKVQDKMVVPSIDLSQGNLNVEIQEPCQQNDAFDSGSFNDKSYSFSRSKSKMQSDIKQNFDDSTLNPIDELRMNNNTQTFGIYDANQLETFTEDPNQNSKTISAIDQSVGVIEIPNNDVINTPENKSPVNKKKKAKPAKGKKKSVNKSILNVSKNFPKNNNKENVRTLSSDRRRSQSKNYNVANITQYKSVQKQEIKGKKISSIIREKKVAQAIESSNEPFKPNIFNSPPKDLEKKASLETDNDNNLDTKEALREKILEHIAKLHEAQEKQQKHNQDMEQSREQHIIVKEYDSKMYFSETAINSNLNLRDINASTVRASKTKLNSKLNLRDINMSNVTLSETAFNSKQNLRDINVESELMRTESNLSPINMNRNIIPDPHKPVQHEPYMNVSEGLGKESMQIYNVPNEGSNKYHKNLETIPSSSRTQLLLQSPQALIGLIHPDSYRTDNSEIYYNNNTGKTPDPNFRVSENYLTTYASNKFLGQDFTMLEESDVLSKKIEGNFLKKKPETKITNTTKYQQRQNNQYSTNAPRSKGRNTKRSSQEKRPRSNSHNKKKLKNPNQEDFYYKDSDVVVISKCIQPENKNTNEELKETYQNIQGSENSKKDFIEDAYHSIGAKDLQRRQAFSNTTKFYESSVKKGNSAAKYRSVDRNSIVRNSIDRNSTLRRSVDGKFRPGFMNTTLINTNKFSKQYGKPIEYKEKASSRCAKNYINYIRFSRNSIDESLDNPKKYQSLVENRSKTPNKISTQPVTAKDKPRNASLDKTQKDTNSNVKSKRSNSKTLRNTANNSLDTSMAQHIDITNKIWTQINTPALEISPQKKVKNEDLGLKKATSTYDKFLKSHKTKGTIVSNKRIRQYFYGSNQQEYEGGHKESKREGFGVLYHKNGVIKYSGYFKNNNLHGKDVKIYNDDTILHFEGEFCEGRKDGYGILYHDNGLAYYKGNFKKNKLDDQNGKIFHKSGILQFEGSIKDGKKHGYGKLCHVDGTLKYIGNFKDDVIHQKGCILYKNGYQFEKINYRNEFSNSYSELNMGHVKVFEGDILGGKKTGPGKCFDNDGKILYEGTFRADKKNGHDCKIYDPNTHLLSYQGEMKNNMKDGIGILYHTNFERSEPLNRESSSIKKSQIDLLSSGKNINQHYIYKGIFKNNHIHNDNAKIYYPNGVVQYYGKVTNGVYQGHGSGHWQETGKLKFEGNFKDDLLNGQNCKVFHSNGAIEYEGSMKAGKRTNVGILYHKNGKPMYAGNFKDDKIHGENLKIYFDNGRLKFEGCMEEGLKQGFGKSWIESGNQIYEGPYYQDLRHGKSCIEYQNYEDQSYNSCKSWPLYVGEMHQGTRRGYGKIFHKNGKLMFAGNFKAVPIDRLMYIYSEDGSIRYIGPPKFIPAEFY